MRWPSGSRARIAELPYTPAAGVRAGGRGPGQRVLRPLEGRFAKRVGVDAETLVLPDDIDQAT
jgi:hypothetical protein